MNNLPFLLKYDPKGSSEGTLDPLGLYLIADQLATLFVPAVRERMLRIRFLTPMTVGALVTENIESDGRHPDETPFLIWEWLVVEAIVRSSLDDSKIWGVPGTSVGKRAITRYGYIDYKSYLKTPRVFGFHGVYKRLAVHLGLIDLHMKLREERGEGLIQSWSKDRGLGYFSHSHPLLIKWRKAVEDSLAQKPVKTWARWNKETWQELAECFLPYKARRRERKYIRDLLLNSKGFHSLGAFGHIWELLIDENHDEFKENKFHIKLAHKFPQYAVLLQAIQAYENYCRLLTDAFEIIRYEASNKDSHGYNLSNIIKDGEFCSLIEKASIFFENASKQLTEINKDIEFKERFGRLAEPLSPENFAYELIKHHEEIQLQKSREGKRPWFDWLGTNRIYMRQNYCLTSRPVLTETYVHNYRSLPIIRFLNDLT